MHSVNLSQAVGMNWRTPNATEADGGPQDPKKRADGGHNVRLRDQVSESSEGSLNPSWEEPLMCWPVNWTQLEPLPVLNWPFRDRGAFVAKRGLPQHEWEPPRTCGKIPNRNARVKAIGNGQDPSALVLAWKMLNRMIVNR